MKGILKTFEAILAILLIGGTYILLFTGQESFPEFDTINWKLLGVNALTALDAKNQLRADALANATSSIEAKLAALIPSPLNYKVLFCISDCGQPELPTTKITSVEYLLAGDYNNVAYRKVVLFLWLGEFA